MHSQSSLILKTGQTHVIMPSSSSQQQLEEGEQKKQNNLLELDKIENSYDYDDDDDFVVSRGEDGTYSA